MVYDHGDEESHLGAERRQIPICALSPVDIRNPSRTRRAADLCYAKALLLQTIYV
jgi:hypothetical protein